MDNKEHNDNDAYTQAFLYELHATANATFFITVELIVVIGLLIAIVVKV